MSETYFVLSDITEGRYAGRIHVQVPYTYHDQIMQVPGMKYKAGFGFSVPKTWPAAITLGELAKDLAVKIKPTPELREWIREQGRIWKDLATRAKAMSAGEKTGLFYLHQLDGIAWLNAPGDPGRLLLDEMGVGKTLTTIGALVEGKHTQTGPVLITCPEAVMETGWFDSITKYAPELTPVIIQGDVTKRRKLLAAVKEGTYQVAIIGLTNLKAHTRFEAFGNTALRKCVDCGGPKLTKGELDEEGNVIPTLDADTGKEVKELTPAQCQVHMKELNEIGWSVIVCDEIHRAMNTTAQVTQALWGVARFAPNDPIRWGLTGTPVSKKADQAWPALHWIWPDGWPVKSAWVDYFCETGYDDNGHWECKGLKPEREAEFQRTYSAVTRRVLQTQVLDLPPLLRWEGLERRVSMGTEQRKAYNSMRDEMLVQVEEGLITAANALSKAGRLTMLASGTGYPSPDDRTKMKLRPPSCKVDEILADFHEGIFEDHQIGMMFESRECLYMVRNALIQAKVATSGDFAIIAGDVPAAMRSQYINAFQAGNKRIAMFTYAAGGTGITLTAADMVLAVQRSWNPIYNSQGVKRFHRVGSERHSAVTVLDYVTANTNEVKQLTRMREDAALLEQIVRDKNRGLKLTKEEQEALTAEIDQDKNRLRELFGG